jgi:hypothetical protein
VVGSVNGSAASVGTDFARELGFALAAGSTLGAEVVAQGEQGQALGVAVKECASMSMSAIGFFCW